MNKNIPCEVIQDLLPSYIDGLASETTENIIKEHLAGCDECNRVYESMKVGAVGSDPGEAGRSEIEKKEIDFLKKNKRKNRRVLIGCIAGALLLTAGLIAAKAYLIGSDYYGAGLDIISVKGNQLVVEAVCPDSAHVLKSIEFTEKDGIVTGVPKAVLPSMIHQRTHMISSVNGDGDDLMTGETIYDIHQEETFSEDIKEIRVGDRIYWADGAEISESASRLYQTRHDYVGDMSANASTARALGISERFGTFTNELETEKEPYGWTIILEEDQERFDKAYLEHDMDRYSYVLLALTGNLSSVTFRYTSGGKETEHTVTAEDATEFFGRDIKVCGTNVKFLNELLER